MTTLLLDLLHLVGYNNSNSSSKSSTVMSGYSILDSGSWVLAPAFFYLVANPAIMTDRQVGSVKYVQ